MKLREIAIVLTIGLSAATLAACPDADPAGHTGFTTCGSGGGIFEQTCQPGQYCGRPEWGECDTGCLSDVNCAANQVCDLSDGSPGTCVNTANVTPTTTTTTTTTTSADAARCESACDAVMGCGIIDNVAVAGCKAMCGSDLAMARLAADCVEAGADCSAKAACVDGFSPTVPPTTTPPTGSEQYITDCKDDCESYNFFGCFEPGEFDSCNAACQQETDGNLQGFTQCNGAVSCDLSCFDYLSKMQLVVVTDPPTTPPTDPPTDTPPTDPPTSQPSNLFQCEKACGDAGFFPCSENMTPALSATEVSSCKASCMDHSEAAIDGLVNCWNAAFLNECTNFDAAGVRACFAGWL